MLRENDIDKEMENEMWAEDFAEIDALLEKWSHEECEAPAELHQSIMGALSSVSSHKPQITAITPISKKKNDAIRYLAAVAVAAGVLLASMAVDKISLDESQDEESINSRIAVSNHTADLDEFAGYSDSTSQVLNDEFSAIDQSLNKSVNNEIDWQKEKEEKTIALAEMEKNLANDSLTEQEKAILESKIAWLEDCLEAIAQQDSEYYEKLLLKSPDNE